MPMILLVLKSSEVNPGRCHAVEDAEPVKYKPEEETVENKKLPWFIFFSIQILA